MPAVASKTLVARRAMARRDLIGAGEQLKLAELSCVTISDRTEVTRLRGLHSLLLCFWNGVRAGSRSLHPGDWLVVEGREAMISAVGVSEITVVQESQDRTYDLTLVDISPGVAESLARLGLESHGPHADRVIAAFHLFDWTSLPIRAEEACRQAVTRGLYVEDLLVELAMLKREIESGSSSVSP